jgi:transcriptional regulator NrdR family protein
MPVNRMGPPCPECGSLCTDVITTRKSENRDIVRRRGCPSCQARFHTVQAGEVVAPVGAVRWSNRRIFVDWTVLGGRPRWVDAFTQPRHT